MSKAAIGLARLCLDPTTADSVVRLGGLDKLFPLAEVSNWLLTITFGRLSILNPDLLRLKPHACVCFDIVCGGGVKKSNGWEFEIGDNRAKVVMWGGGSESHMAATHHQAPAFSGISKWERRSQEFFGTIYFMGLA